MTKGGLFQKEEDIIAAARDRLQEGFALPANQKAFADLLADYERLFKLTKRMIRLSDRNEKQLGDMAERERAISSELADKNAELEGLSIKLSKYLSPQVYDSIFTGAQTVELASQRKKLTIFFSDIAFFTETTDKMESEDLTQMINYYLTEMSEVALAHGATIDKYMGDGIMIFFGDPETRGMKEDALACVTMALAMQTRMGEMADTWRDSGIESPMQCRIGIHTGYCTVGNFGSADRMDYTIIGGAVNLAARLEGQCQPGSVLLSYETYALVRDQIACEEVGLMSMKGLAYPIRTYRALHKLGESADELVSVDLPHLRIAGNLSGLQGDERARARTALSDLLNKLD